MTGPAGSTDTGVPGTAVLVGGPEQREIVIAEPDPTWPARYAAEAGKIKAALPDKARRIEHIGSTAVPGLAAKPIVDILVTVADAEDEVAYVPALERAGYLMRVREPGHRMLRTPAGDVHVHVLADEDPAAQAYLTFRDQLRASPGDRARYLATKRRLAQLDWPTVNHYARAKTDVIRVILARAGQHRRG